MKQITLLVLVFATAFIILFFDRITKNPTQTLPLPYKIDKSYLKTQDIQAAEKSHILILGDSQAINLHQFLNEKLDGLNIGLEEKLKVFNWSETNEGIHRSLFKLKTLKTVPNIVIYLGGSDEFYEKIFNLKSAGSILKNLKLYDNDKVQSAIYLLPVLSRVIYGPLDFVKISPTITPDSVTYNARARQIYYKVKYKLYEYQVNEIIDHSRKNNSTIVMLSNPINYELPPQLECENTYTQSLFEKLSSLEQEINNSQIKNALSQLEQLNRDIPANAKLSYLLGKAYLQTGRSAKARKHLKYARSYDCDPSLSSPVLNKIKETAAISKNTPFIDFDYLLNKNIGRDYLFINNNSPQIVYYERLADILIEQIKIGLNL